MNTPNPQQDAAIEATLSDAYARIQDMIKLQSELDPDNTDSTNYIHQIRARIDELGITDRMREYPPVAHILKYRDTIVEILAATEASVRQLEESKKLPISNEKRQVKIV